MATGAGIEQPQGGGGATVAPSLFVVLAALGQGLRPRQWAKNLLVFAGLLFTFDQGHSPADWLRCLAAFAVFCLLSGCVYLINDYVDREADRAHPRKRLRPIASGRLPGRLALAFAAGAVPATLALSYLLIGRAFALVALVYFALTLAYSVRLKHEVIVDVMTVAAGFILRAVAGATVVAVPSSQWLLTCTGLLALFIGIAKRRSEWVAVTNGGTVQAPPTRPILQHYSLPLLDQMLTIVATSCLIAYFLYSFSSDTGQRHPYLMATSPFVLYGLLRYLYLMHRENKGEAPEEILLTDRPMQVNLALWVGAVLLALSR